MHADVLARAGYAAPPQRERTADMFNNVSIVLGTVRRVRREEWGVREATVRDTKLGTSVALD